MFITGPCKDYLIVRVLISLSINGLCLLVTMVGMIN